MFCNESCHILEFECNHDNFLVFAVKLPELLAYVNIEEETQTRLQQKLLDFLKYAFKPFTLFGDISVISILVSVRLDENLCIIAVVTFSFFLTIPLNWKISCAFANHFLYVIVYLYGEFY